MANNKVILNNFRESFGTAYKFANNKNYKTTCFNSQFWCPSTEAVDTFSVSCTHDNNFVVQPLSLVCKVIKNMEKCRARESLVVPYWSFANFWAVLVNRKNDLESFVKDYRLFQKAKGSIVHGNYKNSGCRKVILHEVIVFSCVVLLKIK